MALAELIADVDRRWRAVNHDDDAFADLAAACLARSAPHAWLSLDAILDHTFAADVLDVRRFNRCPDVLTLYSGPQFGVYAHLWLDAAVELHHHAWNGAFHVLAGTSVHARYVFETDRVVQRKLRLGRLRCRALEQLRAGDTVAVPAGASWIHGLAYSERPGLALSVRATERPEQLRMAYWRPGLAVEAEPPPDLELLRRKAVAFVAGFDAARTRDRLAQWLRAADLRAAFHLMSFARRLPEARDAWAPLCALGRERHGDAFDVVVRAIDDQARIDELQALRARVHDPDLRALLAALCFADAPAHVLAIAEARAPGAPPRVTLCDWVSRLVADDATAALLLGELDPALRDLVAPFAGEPDAERAVARARDELDVEADDGDVTGALHDAYATLRRHAWFGNLLG